MLKKQKAKSPLKATRLNMIRHFALYPFSPQWASFVLLYLNLSLIERKAEGKLLEPPMVVQAFPVLFYLRIYACKKYAKSVGYDRMSNINRLSH
jgi:hypothetical protein